MDMRALRLIKAAMRTLQHEPERWDEQGDPGRFNGALWKRVANLFAIGSAGAIALCREVDLDPYWEPEREVTQSGKSASPRS